MPYERNCCSAGLGFTGNATPGLLLEMALCGEAEVALAFFPCLTRARQYAAMTLMTFFGCHKFHVHAQN